MQGRNNPNLTQMASTEQRVKKAVDRLKEELERKGQLSLVLRMGREGIQPHLRLFSKILAEEMREEEVRFEEIEAVLRASTDKIAKAIDPRYVWGHFQEEHGRQRITQEIERYKVEEERKKDPERLFITQALNLAKQGKWENVEKGFQNGLDRGTFSPENMLRILSRFANEADRRGINNLRVTARIKSKVIGKIKENALKTANDGEMWDGLRELEALRSAGEITAEDAIDALLGYPWKIDALKGQELKDYLGELAKETIDDAYREVEYICNGEGSVKAWKEDMLILTRLAMWKVVQPKALMKIIDRTLDKVNKAAVYADQKVKESVKTSVEKVSGFRTGMNEKFEAIIDKESLDVEVMKKASSSNPEKVRACLDKAIVLSWGMRVELSGLPSPEERVEEIANFRSKVFSSINDGDIVAFENALSVSDDWKALLVKKELSEIRREIERVAFLKGKKGEKFPAKEFYGALFDCSVEIIKKALDESFTEEEGLFFNHLLPFTLNEARLLAKLAGREGWESSKKDVLSKVADWETDSFREIVRMLHSQGKLSKEEISNIKKRICRL